MDKKIQKILLGLGGTATIFFTVSELINYMMANRHASIDFLFKKNESPKEVEKKYEKDYEKNARIILDHGIKEYTITSHDGLALKGYLYEADIPSNRYVFCIHGYRATGIREYATIANFYHDLGMNVFYIDQRACGQSQGQYITYGGLEQNDCMLWLSFMLNKFGKDIKIMLHGESLGSATVMLMLGKELPENVKLAIADCGYATARGQLLHSLKQFHFPSHLFYQMFRGICKLQNGYDPEDVNPVLAIENCKIPVIFAHGSSDDFVPFNMVYAVYDACPNPDKKLVIVEGAGHTKSFHLGNQLKQAITEGILKFM